MKQIKRTKSSILLLPENVESILVITPEFSYNKFCDICAVGYVPNNRICHLHPNICDYCETEYCECRAGKNMKLGFVDLGNKAMDEAVGSSGGLITIERPW